ncbi:hypothetical protein [Streptomyces sp. V1I6]|uniref:hypothetical protein n=1 Tax=Streptomyces sp. V1I6 TaxID=3042273 RepID=UPI0027D7E22A|nr:hypothetical protein [Streptomyces sp. V1I6]
MSAADHGPVLNGPPVPLDALKPFADNPCEETAMDHEPAEQSHSTISAVAVNRASRDVSSL